MKKRILLFATMAIFLAINATAALWRVNNNYGVNADFSNLQTAINAENVQPFDTLYVEGSSTSYGGIYIDRPLILIGAGFFLNENDTTQAIKFPSKIQSVNFSNGSDGSILKGCSFVEFVDPIIQIYASNITFSRNYINVANPNNYGNLYAIYITNSNLTNIVIENNFIYVSINYSQNYYSYAIYSNSSGLGLSINNNFISSSSYFNYPQALYLTGDYCTYSIHNNVFKGGLNTKNGAFVNNILIEGSVSGSNNFYFYSLCNGTQFGNVSGNQQNVNMSTVFVNHTSGVDNGLILAPGSPAIGAGFNGVDCGIFDGNNPYVLSGIPPIPSIFEINQIGIGSVNSPIEVNLKAKSNH